MKPYRKTRTTLEDLGRQHIVAVDARKLAAVTGGAVRKTAQFESGGENSRMCIMDTEVYWE